MKNKPSVTIIGTGAVGSALLQFFNERNYIISSFWNSKTGSVYQKRPKNVKITDYSLPRANQEIGDIVFITTPDDSITGIAKKLAESEINWNRKSVVHCSGNLTSAELNLLNKQGAKIASMHPIQTFKPGDGKERFESIFISLEGDQDLCSDLEKIVKKMGAKSLSLTKDQKRILHIAAVLSSNYMVALLHKAESYLHDAQLSQGLDILKPLVNQTVINIFREGTVESLTGPISRGDYLSLEKHLNALIKEDSITNLYKLLGRETLEITKKRRNISDSQIEKMQKLLVD